MSMTDIVELLKKTKVAKDQTIIQEDINDGSSGVGIKHGPGFTSAGEKTGNGGINQQRPGPEDENFEVGNFIAFYDRVVLEPGE